MGHAREEAGLAVPYGGSLTPYQLVQRYFLLDVGGYTGSTPEGCSIRDDEPPYPVRCRGEMRRQFFTDFPEEWLEGGAGSAPRSATQGNNMHVRGDAR